MTSAERETLSFRIQLSLIKWSSSPPVHIFEHDDPRYEEESRTLRDWLSVDERQRLESKVNEGLDAGNQLGELLIDHPARAKILANFRKILQAQREAEALAPLDDDRKRRLARANAQIGAEPRSARAKSRNEIIFRVAREMRHEDPTVSDKAIAFALLQDHSATVQCKTKTILNALSSREGQAKVPKRALKRTA
jgi:uncharacterized protein (DUF2267 family)